MSLTQTPNQRGQPRTCSVDAAPAAHIADIRCTCAISTVPEAFYADTTALRRSIALISHSENAPTGFPLL